ncbi:mucin-5AC [Mustela lutreola]|uniref:mucin-5AC n=1 Tax=Mustela lutreola TaxID=9666 RepID=UPI00279765E8|nr:mucin-5AC [Mustela lutreola]
MGVASRMLAPLWALALALACAQHVGQAQGSSVEHSHKSPELHVPQELGGHPLRGMSFLPPLRTAPVVRARNPAHNGRVCSSWGDFHYKTFDGDIFRFPGRCNYVLSAHCGAAYEDFNVQLRRGGESNATTVTAVTMKLDGMVIQLTKSSILVNGRPTQPPFSQSGVLIEVSNGYLKVDAKLGLVLMWSPDDSLLLELDPKFANQTCGLCGDFNGQPVFNEFLSHGVKLTALEYGNLQKMDGPTEQCQDPVPVPPTDCGHGTGPCEEILTGQLFSGCRALLDAGSYVQACRQDLCLCEHADRTRCICPTLAEYARQCAHAGGLPPDWRSPHLCPQTCPPSMQHRECGSPCADTCSNPEHSQLCEDHCVDGCFCPEGTVLDDIGQTGCIPASQCPCVYNGATYAPGTSYATDCTNCTCSRGQWSCRELPCPGTCAVLGGAHISTFDERQYTVHGDCSYVLAKPCDSSVFTVLGELRRCGLTDTETCLKSLTLSLDGGHTVVTVKASGEVFVNQIYTQMPVSAANVTLFRPSTFFIVAQTKLGLQLTIQLVPVMQVFVRLGPELRGLTCGLCGNFNQNQADDFRTLSGVVEGTAAAFANTWKTQASCPNVKNSFEDPCSLSVENEKYAQRWCSRLTDPRGPFAQCHVAVNPGTFYSNCMFDTCNCEKSEDCLCAALSSYVHACASKGVLLRGWRDGVCAKPMATCPKSLTYQYSISTCQPTCRARSHEDITCGISFVPVDGCTCPNGTFLDEAGKCVPATSCPCYHEGSVVPNGESLHERGVICTCTQGTLTCIGGQVPTPVCTPPMVFLDCRNATPGASGAGCQKSCFTLDMDCYSPQCEPGCVCPDGLVADGEGRCVAPTDCPCVHNEASYLPGQTIRVGCNTCTCENRKWRCTEEPCLATCAVYGDGHYVTFDGRRYSFSGDCGYTLLQDHCRGNDTTGTFRVVSENVPCGTTGVTCSKAIKLFLGSFELRLSEGRVEVLERGVGQEPPYSIRQMGIYLVVDTEAGLVLLWDRKTSIFLKLSPEFKGRVCGLCGNFDDKAINDFTTRGQSVVGSALEFGNSWKFSPACPDAPAPRDPCTANPYRKSWAQKQCSIINSATFAACHAHVEPTKYYEACVGDACACDSGGDCECFCTAVAAYAQACHDVGVCVSWRTPDTCPLFCDYYNPEGQCEWHYQPCGAPCMRTCRNPGGRCLHDLPGLEGCYPKCPPAAPIFDEDRMQCVATCPTPPPPLPCRVRGKSYRPGTVVPSDQNCHSCICTENGVQCAYDSEACVCIYDGRHFRPGDVIYHTTDGTGGCLSARCSANGTIERGVSPCSATSPAPPTTFSFSTSAPVVSSTRPPRTCHDCGKSTVPTGTTPGTTVQPHQACGEECQWSPWLDISRPGRGTDSGDFETLENLRAHGYQVCAAPKKVECQAEEAPGVPLQVLGQHVECSPTVGLTCYNHKQTSGLCHNYQIRILCCFPRTCSPSSSPAQTTPPAASGNTETGPTREVSGVSSVPTEHKISPATVAATGTSILSTTSETPAPGATVPVQATATTTPGTPTPAPGTTTTPPGTPTPAPGTTTTPPGTPTPAPGTTTTPPATPTPAPGTTTTPPGTPTPAPGTTTTPPGTPTPAPGTTTTPPATPTPAPGTTTTPPGTPTPAPGTTTTPPGTPTPAPGTTTTPPGTPTPAPGTTTTPPGTPTPVLEKTTLLTLTPMPISTTHEPCLKQLCTWTHWIDSSYPEPGINSGDFDTFPNLRAKGYKFCAKPNNVECRAEFFPNVPLEELGQDLICDKNVGLLCLNKNQLPPICYNYAIRIECCEQVDVCTSTPHAGSSEVTHPTPRDTETQTQLTRNTGVASLPTQHGIASSAPVHPAASTTPNTYRVSSPVTVTCQPQCTWTKWFDVDFPSPGPHGGDVESFSNIMRRGEKICRRPEYISRLECRAESHPEVSIEKLGQVVQCDLSKGLVCRNRDQGGNVGMCLNYEVRVLCCEPPEHCTTHKTVTVPHTPSMSPTSLTETTVHLVTSHSTSVPTSSLTKVPETSSTPVPTTNPRSVPETSSTSVPTTSPTSVPETSSTSVPTTSPTSVPETSSTPVPATSPTSVPETSSTPVPTTNPRSVPETSSTSVPTTSPRSVPETSSTSVPTTSPTTVPETSSTPVPTTSPRPVSETSSTTVPTTSPRSVPETSSTPVPTTSPRPVPETRSTPVPTTSPTSVPTTSPRPVPETSSTPVPTTNPRSVPETSSTSVPTTSPTSVPETSSTSVPTTSPTSVPETSSTPVPATSPKSVPETSSTTVPGSSPTSMPTTSATTVSQTSPTSVPPTGTTSAPTASTTPFYTPEATHSPPVTVTCQPRCTWTKWFDVDFPSPGPHGGDVESFSNIMRRGEKICRQPEYISRLECRAESHPEVSIEKLGQVVQCDLSKGLVCRNRDQGGNVGMCLNYEVRVLCCEPPEHCTTHKTVTVPHTPSMSPTSLTETTTSSTSVRTISPTSVPETSSTSVPTTSPTSVPETSSTSVPTTSPTSVPETSSTSVPTTSPTSVPETSSTSVPTTSPRSVPETSSTSVPTTSPTTTSSTSVPTTSPTSVPETSSTSVPTTSPTSVPETSSTTVPGSSPTSMPTTGTTSAPTASTTPFYTPEATHSPPVTVTCQPRCTWTKWFDVDFPSPGPHGGDVESFSNIMRRGEKICRQPEYISRLECRAESHPEVSIEKLGQVVQCDLSKGLVCRNRDQGGNVGMCLNYEVRVLCCELPEHCGHTSVTPSSAPPEHMSVVSSVPWPSSTAPASTTCFCSVSGKLYPAGSIIYQQTDLDGHCYYATCSLDCRVVRQMDQSCPSSVAPPAPTTSQPGSSPSAPVPITTQGCPNAVPPRMKGETWPMPNCSQATCEGHGVITVHRRECPRAQPPTCANGFPPVQVADQDGCCPRYQCQCVCSGWGDPHYITFDGTYYTFLDSCTYVLVQQVVPVYGHFRVLIDNYLCGAENGVSCPQSIIVEYRGDRVVLTRKPVLGVMTNEIIFNDRVVRPGFQKDGVSVSQIGIKMYVTIPELGVQVMFSGLIFSVEVPFSKFANNTEGQCGTCTNDKKDECRLPGGAVAASCSDMSGHWKVTTPQQPSCHGPSPTPTAARPAPSPTLCSSSPICRLILSKVFEPCHAVIPPLTFYQGCVFDHCHVTVSDVVCSGLELYASLCASRGVCIDWRSHTNHTCPFACPADKVYQPCGPSKLSYCYGRDNASLMALQDAGPITEGCFCPEGLMPFSTSSEVCVPTDCHRCLGPHGEPVEPGHTVSVGCQRCTCENGTWTLSCRPQPCPLPPACPAPGLVPVPAAPQADQCCPQYNCACDTSYCPKPVACPKGSHPILTYEEGACCPHQNCSWSVCSANGTLFQPGSVISSSLCETCRCEVPGSPHSDTAVISCETQICNTRCPEGFEYREQSGRCCGGCVQQACVLNATDGSPHLFYPGQSWPDPTNPCVTHECEKHQDGLVVVTRKKACPPLSCPADQARLSEDGCCLSCPPPQPQNRSACALFHERQVLHQQGCRSPRPVRLAFCRGSCGDSVSVYSQEANALRHSCECCQERRVSLRNVTLRCPDGSHRAFSYPQVEECGCVRQRCGSHGALGHGADSGPVQSDEEQSQEVGGTGWRRGSRATGSTSGLTSPRPRGSRPPASGIHR